MYADLGDGARALAVVQKIEDLKSSGRPGYAGLAPEKIYYARGTIQFWYRELDQALGNLKRVASNARTSTSIPALMRGCAWDRSTI